MLGTDYLNTEGYLYWQLHRKNVFSPGELGCSFSHLKAIHQAYLDGEDTALIVEDDIVMDDAPHWPEAIQDLVTKAPADWGVLQLWTNNPSFYKYVHQGQSGDQVDPVSMKEVDLATPVCEDGQYTRPPFVPWYDDAWPEGQGSDAAPLPPLHGGLWSTMAYLINRKAMATILEKMNMLDGGKATMGKLRLPVLADHLLFKSARTYTYTRPLFRAFPRTSTIQPTTTSSTKGGKGGKGGQDMEGRVEEGFDPWEMSDGLTNTFASEYWAAGSWEKATPTTGYCPLTSAKHTQLRVVVLATASFTANERAIQQANVERLARGNRATRSWDVVLYALNAIDNKHDEWLGWA